MVMTAPIKKQMAMMMTTLLFLKILEPTPWPSGVMEISAPSWKKPMPTISRTAPIKKRATVPISSGTSTTLKMSTMSVMGSTLERDS